MHVVWEEERLKKNELEKAYYGVSSTDIFLEMHEYISNHIKISLHGISNYLKQSECQDEKRIEIIKELYNKNMKALEPLLDKFKEELQKVFEVPINTEKKQHFSDDDITELKKEVQQLQQEYFGEQVFLAKLKQQQELFESIDSSGEHDIRSADVIRDLENGFKKKKENETLTDEFEEEFKRFYTTFVGPNMSKYFEKDQDKFDTLLEEFNNS